MSPRRWLLALLLLAAALWTPLLKPAGQSLILLTDVYGAQLVGTDLAALVTPEPRVSETNERVAGTAMRVTSWRPGWGDEHPAILIVPGASPRGNDEPVLRSFAVSLARAGYLVVLPELPFLKEGRFDPDAQRQIDAAFAHARALPETRGRPAGAFGVSVGGGLMLAAAGREPALRGADFLAVLGAYYDLDTYLASLASRTQRLATGDVPWEPSAEAQERLGPAALELVPPDERELAQRALERAPYDEALRRIRALPARSRAAYDAASPETVWREIVPPIFWIHDPADSYEPLAEAERAAAAERPGRFRLVVPRLVQHAYPGGDAAKAEGPLFVAGELARLLGFTFELLRTAG